LTKLFDDAPVRHVTLPEAQRERWQPIRGGLLNIFRFDYEEFRYEQGRLLLRGNNGTGKSRILALQLPFLLDGEIAPHRMEPDGDPAKRMEWNLLLDKHADRLGYTWIEFGRRESDGTTHYLTLGCGLHAVEGRGIHARWFFITSQRIGRDLFLATSTGQPLGKSRLEEELAGAGELYLTAEVYRRAVDRALFKLGDRYGDLLDLLVQLRQPQLSRKLDEQRLSEALSQALPPLSERVISDVADAFRSLESERDQLTDLETAVAAVGDFLRDYRRYAQIAGRRRAEGVRKAHSEYEDIMRQLRKAEADATEAQASLAVANERLAQLEIDQAAANAAVEALLTSPEMRNADDLASARQLETQNADAADEAKQDLDRALETRSQADSERNQAIVRSDDAKRASICTYESVRAAAREVGLDSILDSAIGPSRVSGSAEAGWIDSAESVLREAVQQKRNAVAHLRTLDELVERRRHDFERAVDVHSQCSAQSQQAVENQRSVQRTLESAMHEALKVYRDWASQLTELPPRDADEVAHDLSHWLETGEGPAPLSRAVEAWASAASAIVTRGLADANQRRLGAQEPLTALRIELDRLSAGYETPPPTPYTRSVETRSTRTGAPLWSICDFSPELDDRARAGIEAAMEAAGLLDAWITPEGRLLAADDHDTQLVAETSLLPPEDAHLGTVLVPDLETGNPQSAGISEATLSAVLRHVGFSASGGEIRVDVTGQWQLGPLRGAWSKAAAQFIGKPAREADRRRRLTDVASAIADAESIIRAIDLEIVQLNGRLKTIELQRLQAPDENAIREALSDVQAAARQVSQLRDQLVEAETAMQDRRSDFNTATGERNRDARDLGIVEWVDKTSAFDEALTRLRETLPTLWPGLRSRLTIDGQTGVAERRAADAAMEEDRRRRLFADASQRLGAARGRCSALESTIGAKAAEIEAQLQRAKAEASAIHDSWKQVSESRRLAGEKRAAADVGITGCQSRLRDVASHRDEMVARLTRFVDVGLSAVAMDDGNVVTDASSWSMTRAVELARRMEALFENIVSDDPAWERNQKEIHKHLEELKEALLAHHYAPDVTFEDNLIVVTVPFQGHSCDMPQLEQALSAEIAQRQLILNAREREVLERHLIGEVATQLHDLLHGAERLVDEMNDELTARPTSTGMRLRFLWQPMPEGPVGLVEARRRLMGAEGTWSPAERAAVADFLQQQIQATRTADQTRTWQEHLAVALDYRRWHQFGVEREQDGQWKRLTKRTYGTGSGGEKAIALTIPQFAAAAAHYRTADPLAPRLILLDEAFVGVDPNMRSKCLDLLCAFDLDVVMTSEHEWGCYKTVPGLAIYQLATRPGIDAVGITRWVWNGRSRIQDKTALPNAWPEQDGHQPHSLTANDNGSSGP